jgi:Transposase DDE domain group 1
VHPTSTRPTVTVTTDGAGVVSHAGSRLLADLADTTTLTGELSEVLALAGRRRVHDPGRVLVDMAVAVADGASTISDVAVLEHQPALFGPVASDSTCWRLLDRIDDTALGGIASARAAAREVAWAQHAEIRGTPFPVVSVAGRDVSGLVLDLDASIVITHSEKEQAAPTFKGTFGFHPMLAFCDNTGEFLSAKLRRGNAGANTAADHVAVLDAALVQVPEAHRYGTPILVRADTAGCTKAFLAHVRSLQDRGVACEFSVGWAVNAREHDAIATVPKHVWVDAIDADGAHRDGAGLAEITGLLPAKVLADYPSGIRVIVRRERPHPGAQLDLIETRDGWRYTAFATDTRVGQLAFLDARHRAHARVEDRIRTAKDTGLQHFPSRAFAINAAWLAVVMLAVDLIAWTQHLLLEGTLAKAEPKTLRYRLLHVAARLTRGQRRLWLRLQRCWPWARELADAFARLRALPVPAG